MSMNLHQIYLANPITTNVGTDLMYFMRSPYGTGTDAAMLFSDFAAQFSGGGATPAQVQQGAFNVGTDTGVADAYVVDLSPAVTSLTDGLIVIFNPANDNLTAFPTLQLNGLTPVGIQLVAGGGILAGDINHSNNQPCFCVYSAAKNIFQLYTPWLSYVSQQSVGGFQYNISFNPANIGNDYTDSTFAYFYGGSSFFGQVQFFIFNPSATNTGSATLNLNNLGIHGIILPNGNELSGGELVQGLSYLMLQMAYPDLRWMVINPTSAGTEVNLSKTILTPVNGDTVTLLIANKRTIINPAGTLATLTVNMPASPVDGQVQRFSFTHVITTLTVSGNGNTIVAAPTTTVVGSSYEFTYNLGTTTWYPT